MASHLRLFPTPDSDAEEGITVESAVGIRLGDLLPLIALAQKMHFVWLKDFLDDEVRISSDLHDVLQAFRSLKPAQ